MNYFFYRFKYNFNFLFKTPAHLDIELNNNCNQKCLSCWHNDPKNLPFKIKKMSLEKAKHVIDQAEVLKVKSVKFNLRGEPCFYAVFEKVLKNSGLNYRILDFFPWGSDERQFCSPGIDLPVCAESLSSTSARCEHSISGKGEVFWALGRSEGQALG